MQPREGQALKWVRAKALRDYPMPPADAPLIPIWWICWGKRKRRVSRETSVEIGVARLHYPRSGAFAAASFCKRFVKLFQIFCLKSASLSKDSFGGFVGFQWVTGRKLIFSNFFVSPNLLTPNGENSSRRIFVPTTRSGTGSLGANRMLTIATIPIFGNKNVRIARGPNLIVAGDWSGRRDMRGSVSSMVSDHIRRPQTPGMHSVGAGQRLI